MGYEDVGRSWKRLGFSHWIWAGMCWKLIVFMLLVVGGVS